MYTTKRCSITELVAPIDGSEPDVLIIYQLEPLHNPETENAVLSILEFVSCKYVKLITCTPVNLEKLSRFVNEIELHIDNLDTLSEFLYFHAHTNTDLLKGHALHIHMSEQVLADDISLYDIPFTWHLHSENYM